MVDARRVAQRAVPDRIGHNIGDFRLLVAERAQGQRHCAIDDPEIAAAGQLLELDQGEIRFDSSGVAIHDQADGAGRRDHRGLRVSVAMGLAHLQRPVPGGDCRGRQVLLRAGLGIERHRRDGKALIALALALRRAAMVTHDAQHMLRIGLVTGEGAQFLGHFRRCRIGGAGHQRGDGAA